jgi:hypothetical protein
VIPLWVLNPTGPDRFLEAKPGTFGRRPLQAAADTGALPR